MTHRCPICSHVGKISEGELTNFFRFEFEEQNDRRPRWEVDEHFQQYQSRLDTWLMKRDFYVADQIKEHKS